MEQSAVLPTSLSEDLPEVPKGSPSVTRDFREFLRKSGAGPNRSRHLTLEEAHAAGVAILSGQATPGQAGGQLIAMRVGEESPEEIAGFALAIRDFSQPPDITGPILDCAGAYDGRVRTTPVGVAAALVARSAGVKSCFHGVRGLGRAGVVPGEILDGLANISVGPDPGGVIYCDQSYYCPVLAHLKRFRNDLGLRTVFNSAEKLVDLAGLAGQERALLVGAFHGGFIEKMAEAALLAGFGRALVVQGLEGSDDVPITRDSRVCELKDGVIAGSRISLEEIGITPFSAAAMESRGAAEALSRLSAALAGEAGPVAEAIVLNTAIRLYLADRVEGLAEGVREARMALAAGWP